MSNFTCATCQILNNIFGSFFCSFVGCTLIWTQLKKYTFCFSSEFCHNSLDMDIHITPNTQILILGVNQSSPENACCLDKNSYLNPVLTFAAVLLLLLLLFLDLRE